MGDQPEQAPGGGGGDPFLFEPAATLLSSRLDDLIGERAPGLEQVDCGCGQCGCGTCFCGGGGCNCAIAIA